MRKIIWVLIIIAASAKAADYNETFKPLKFREIGPAVMGGRIDDFAVVESNPNIIYVGTASGGVFKTINRSPRSATSPSPHPIHRSSGSAAASRTIARALRGATASTNRPTAARAG